MLGRLRGTSPPTQLARPQAGTRGGLPGPNTPERWRFEHSWLDSWRCPLNLIAGESFRQPALRKLARREGGCLRPVNVHLEPEPENAHDSNAVRATVDGVHVGYLRAHAAAILREGCVETYGCGVPKFVVAGVVRGGAERNGEALFIGVHVWVERRISAGPAITVDDSEDFEVSWPPTDTELEALAQGQPPAAWHPDPSGRHELRYWDGAVWSRHVSDEGAGGVDALGDR